jgi:hypothetical protein
MRKIAFLLLCSFVMAACASTENYRLAVSSWQGGDAQTLVHVWGYPDHIQRAPDGNRLYVYRVSERGRNPVYTSPGMTQVRTGKQGETLVVNTPPLRSGGGTYHYVCTTWFEVSEQGTIVNTSFRGNDCTGASAFVHTHANPAMSSGG